MQHRYDAIILGAGAAGLYCGIRAGIRGHRTLVIDHSAKPAEKVRISGGGRCNFTNLHTSADRFLSRNPHFAKSALARHTPWDFMDFLSAHDLTWHEKTLGQLFCDQKSGAIIQALITEFEARGGTLQLGTPVTDISHADGIFSITTETGTARADNLVIATGGLSIPKIGATRFAYDLATRFGHEMVETRPALVPLTFSGDMKDAFAALSGVSCQVRAQAGSVAFSEGMLFTHRGLSGPAILQASSYWREGEDLILDFFPETEPVAAMKSLRDDHPKQTIAAGLANHLPKRLVEHLENQLNAPNLNARLGEASNQHLETLAARLSSWPLKPTGTEGYRTAEVTLGGIDTDGLSSRTMESRMVPGLFFIGECVDVTGWLGGYNFQWAWASADACADALHRAI